MFSKTETDKIAIVLRSLAVWMRDENSRFSSRALSCRIFEVVGLQVVDIVRLYVNVKSYMIAQVKLWTFYRAMHFSAKRGIAIACRLSVRLSVRPSVCDVGEL